MSNDTTELQKQIYDTCVNLQEYLLEQQRSANGTADWWRINSYLSAVSTMISDYRFNLYQRGKYGPKTDG